ncbi:hypothetical protein [Nocardioides marmoribigeumensis]|uniref:Uncharacterized protein n=1 Tax=Nocardioides marmoribigeumensis TaxID=433649 RepID=A0ABU2BU71_9ACTN|nr:hypothetical protein [Nocardioides marmoribigeumensis]MDR7362177.1 hypothetical protein [Nocardioides marmoribigeumensis]
MADKDTEGPDESSLELPSLFGRKKKPKRDRSAPAPARGSSRTPAAEDTAVVEPVREPVTEPVTEPVAEPVSEPTTVVEPVTEPVREPEPPTQQIPPAAPAPVRQEEPSRGSAPAADPAPAGARKAPARAARRARPARSLPPLAASVAALVVGALVGLLGVGLTIGSLKACDAITGTDSCGGPGLLVVLAVVIVMVMAGSALLRAFGVSEPGGLSFLGVAIFVAICLVFLLEQLLEPWMIVVGPALCALGYGTAHWVVNRFNTELLAEDGPEAHDIR